MLAKYGGECPRCGTYFPSGTPIHRKSDSNKWYPDDCKGCQKRDLELPTRLNELLKPLNLGKYRTPKYHNQSLFHLECWNEFEPFGRATESWDLVWRITLNGDDGRVVEGRDIYEVISKAISWVTDNEG